MTKYGATFTRRAAVVSQDRRVPGARESGDLGPRSGGQGRSQGIEGPTAGGRGGKRQEGRAVPGPDAGRGTRRGRRTRSAQERPRRARDHEAASCRTIWPSRKPSTKSNWPAINTQLKDLTEKLDQERSGQRRTCWPKSRSRPRALKCPTGAFPGSIRTARCGSIWARRTRCGGRSRSACSTPMRRTRRRPSRRAASKSREILGDHMAEARVTERRPPQPDPDGRSDLQPGLASRQAAAVRADGHHRHRRRRPQRHEAGPRLDRAQRRHGGRLCRRRRQDRGRDHGQHAVPGARRPSGRARTKPCCRKLGRR